MKKSIKLLLVLILIIGMNSVLANEGSVADTSSGLCQRCQQLAIKATKRCTIVEIDVCGPGGVYAVETSLTPLWTQLNNDNCGGWTDVSNHKQPWKLPKFWMQPNVEIILAITNTSLYPDGALSFKKNRLINLRLFAIAANHFDGDRDNPQQSIEGFKNVMGELARRPNCNLSMIIDDPVKSWRLIKIYSTSLGKTDTMYLLMTSIDESDFNSKL